MNSDKEAREQVIQVTNELFSLGLMTATGGNVSALAADPNTVWITPTRMYKGGLESRDLVRIDSEGRVLEGERAPSIEWRMHFASYAAQPGSTGAVHTHAPIATAFGITHQRFPPINTDAVTLRDTVMVPWIMPGSRELSEAVGEALRKSRGCILQNHGLMTIGRDLREAATLSMVLEETAKIVLYVKQFGGDVSLIPEQWVEQIARLSHFV